MKTRIAVAGLIFLELCGAFCSRGLALPARLALRPPDTKEDCEAGFVASLKPVLGALIQLNDKSKILLLDSYLQSSHEDMIRRFLLSSETPEDQMKILWLGEAEVSVGEGLVSLHRVNNASALIQKWRDADPRLPYFCHGQDLTQIHSRHLLAQTFDGVSSSTQQIDQSLDVAWTDVPESIIATIRDRHEIKNVFTVINVVLSLIQRKPDSVDGLNMDDFFSKIEMVVKWIEIYQRVEVKPIDDSVAQLTEAVRRDLLKILKAKSLKTSPDSPNYKVLSENLINMSHQIFDNEKPTWLQIHL